MKNTQNIWLLWQKNYDRKWPGEKIYQFLILQGFLSVCYIIVVHFNSWFNPLDTEGRGGGSPLRPCQHVFVIFCCLLNFWRQWQLCKFIILGDLSTHLFGLVFLKCSFSYTCVYTNTGTLFRQLAPSFLGWNLNKYDKLCILPYIYFILKNHRKPHVDTRYKRILICFLQFINHLW